MAILISTLLLSFILFKNGESGTIGVNKLDKKLFVPTFNYPTLIHLHPTGYGTEGLENAALYPQYSYNHDYYEYADSLQKQTLYQNAGIRLEDILHTGDKRKTSKNDEKDEEDYNRKSNNILYFEEMKPELEDLDRKYKRSLTYTSWLPQSLHSATVNENPSPTSNLRAVPFGPYTTWSPYQAHTLTWPHPQPEKVNTPKEMNRRRRDVQNLPYKQVVKAYVSFKPQPETFQIQDQRNYEPAVKSAIYEPRYIADS